MCGEAGNGREAIEKAVELAPDLIILDIAMPVLDGIGAAKAIRAQLPDVPIVMYTFLFFDHLELMVKQAGAQALVQKGDLRALIREIRGVLAAVPWEHAQATPGAAPGDDAQMLSATGAAGATAAPAEMDAPRMQIAEDSAGGDPPPVTGEEQPGD